MLISSVSVTSKTIKDALVIFWHKFWWYLNTWKLNIDHHQNVMQKYKGFRKIVFELHLQILRHFDTTWSSNTICKATYNWATNQMCAEVHTTKTAVFINIHDNDTLEYWLGKWKTCFWYPHTYTSIYIYMYILIPTNIWYIYMLILIYIWLFGKNFP